MRIVKCKKLLMFNFNLINECLKSYSLEGLTSLREVILAISGYTSEVK